MQLHSPKYQYVTVPVRLHLCHYVYPAPLLIDLWKFQCKHVWLALHLLLLLLRKWLCLHHLLTIEVQITLSVSLRTHSEYFHPILQNPHVCSGVSLGNWNVTFSYFFSFFVSDRCHQLFYSTLLLMAPRCLSSHFFMGSCLCILWSPIFLFQFSHFIIQQLQGEELQGQ